MMVTAVALLLVAASSWTSRARPAGPVGEALALWGSERALYVLDSGGLWRLNPATGERRQLLRVTRAIDRFVPDEAKEAAWIEFDAAPSASGWYSLVTGERQTAASAPAEPAWLQRLRSQMGSKRHCTFESLAFDESGAVFGCHYGPALAWQSDGRKIVELSRVTFGAPVAIARDWFFTAQGDALILSRRSGGEVVWVPGKSGSIVSLAVSGGQLFLLVQDGSPPRSKLMELPLAEVPALTSRH